MKIYKVEMAVFNEEKQVNNCHKIFAGTRVLADDVMSHHFDTLLRDGATPVNCYEHSFMFETDDGTEISLILSRVA